MPKRVEVSEAQEIVSPKKRKRVHSSLGGGKPAPPVVVKIVDPYEVNKLYFIFHVQALNIFDYDDFTDGDILLNYRLVQQCLYYIYICMHGWRMRYGRCGRCHTNFAHATPTFFPFIIIGHTNFDLLVNHIMFWPHQLWKPSSAHVCMS